MIDVAIIGGGPAGSALGACLLLAGINSAIIERGMSPPSDERDHFDWHEAAKRIGRKSRA